MKRIFALFLLALPLSAAAQLSNEHVHKFVEHNNARYRTEIRIPGFMVIRHLSVIFISIQFCLTVLCGLLSVFRRLGGKVLMPLPLLTILNTALTRKP